MMLHRHFEAERAKQRENMTTLSDVTPGAKSEDFVSEVFPPDEADADEPKRRGRPKKTDSE